MDLMNYLLFIIFKKSLDEDFVPDDWKTANISPIFNKKAVLPQGNRAMPQLFFLVLTAILFHFLSSSRYHVHFRPPP